MPPFAAELLVFSASAAVLVIEILAARLLGPYVGDTLETYTAIIGTVLAGIALGAFAGGRLADRSDPRGLLGPTLVLGGALTLAIIPIVAAFGPALVGGGAPATVILSALAFFGPASVLSAVSPMVVKLQLDALEETGSVVGRLSAIGTAGAIVGTFLTGFVLVAAFPTRPTLLALGAAVIAGGIGLHLAVRAAGTTVRSPIAAVLVFGLFGAGVTAIAPTQCDVETAYYCASVRPGIPPCEGLTLYLDRLNHSCVHPGEPERLDFTYVRTIASVADALQPPPGAVRALHIGGGGFSLPGYLTATRPGSTNVVIEIDPALIDLVERRLGVRPGPDLRVNVRDARVALHQEPSGAYDLVIGDAFGGVAVPWHLTTAEFAREVRRVLRPGGVYAVNVIDNPPFGFARAETATLLDTFPHVAALAPPRRFEGAEGGNFILVAGLETIDVEAVTAALTARSDGYVAAVGPSLNTFIRDAHVLTDDHAPVDQLLTPFETRR